MGAGTIAVILIAIIIVVVVFPSAVDDIFKKAEKTKEDLLDKQATKQFQNNPAAGDKVCDLKVEVSGNMDRRIQDIFNSELNVFVKSSNIKPSWVNCRELNTYSLLSVVERYWTDGGLQQLYFINPLGVNDFNLALTGDAGTGKILVDGYGRIEWNKNIAIPQVIDTPYFWKTTFFISDVKGDNYSMQLNAENRHLNDQKVNTPITFTVKKP